MLRYFSDVQCKTILNISARILPSELRLIIWQFCFAPIRIKLLTCRSLVDPSAAQRKEQERRMKEKNLEAQDDEEEETSKACFPLGKKVLYSESLFCLIAVLHRFLIVAFAWFKFCPSIRNDKPLAFRLIFNASKSEVKRNAILIWLQTNAFIDLYVCVE